MERWLVLAGAGLLSAAAAAAQGADDCSNAQVISGLGPHAFDNTSATKDGPNDCDGQPARKDVWFKWTAPATGGYVIDTCGQANVETRIMIYDDQPCPVTSAPIACGAVGCNGVGTRFSFPTTANAQYLIRVGSRNFAQSGSGTFTMLFDNCWNISDDAFEDNDTCPEATPVGDGLYTGLFVSKVDKDFYEIDVDDGATVTINVLFTHATGDIDCFLFDACGGNTLVTAGSGDDNESISWTNTTGACLSTFLEVQHWAPDVQSECQTYDLDIVGSAAPGSCDPPSGQIGNNYCGPANLNSSGQSAEIAAFGSEAVADNDVRLDATKMPASEFGMFLNSMKQGFVQPPGSQGNLCLGGGIGRYKQDIQNTGASGEFSLQLDLGNTPTPGGPVAIQPGETWYFSTWFRDKNPGQTSNFTDGVCIDFQ